MHNRYTIEVYETAGQVKATVYVGRDCLGSIWNPVQYVKNKEDFYKLFESVSGVIYGQEKKAAKEEKSYCKIIAAIETENKREQKALQQEEV